MRGGMYSQGMMGVGGGGGMPYAAQQPGAQGMSPFQGVMSVLGVVGGIAQFADAALEAVHVFLSLSARLCDRLGWARQELSGAVAAASAAAAAARATRASTSSGTSANLRRLLICAAVRGHDVCVADAPCVVQANYFSFTTVSVLRLVHHPCPSGRRVPLDPEAAAVAPQGWRRCSNAPCSRQPRFAALLLLCRLP